MGFLRWVVTLIFISSQSQASVNQCRSLLSIDGSAARPSAVQTASKRVSETFKSFFYGMSPQDASIYQSKVRTLQSRTYKEVLNGAILERLYSSSQGSLARAEVLAEIQNIFEQEGRLVLSMLQILNKEFKVSKVEKAYKKDHGSRYPRIGKEIGIILIEKGPAAVEEFLADHNMSELKDELLFNINSTKHTKYEADYLRRNGKLPPWSSLVNNISYYSRKILKPRNLIIGVVLLFLLPLVMPAIDFRNGVMEVAEVSSRQLSVEVMSSVQADMTIMTYDTDQLDAYYKTLVEDFGSTKSREDFERDFEGYIQSASRMYREQITRTQSTGAHAVEYADKLKAEQVLLYSQISLAIHQISESAKDVQEAFAKKDPNRVLSERAIQKWASVTINTRMGSSFEAYDEIRYRAMLFYFANTGSLGISHPDFNQQGDVFAVSLDPAYFSAEAISALALWKDAYLFNGGLEADFKRLGIN